MGWQDDPVVKEGVADVRPKWMNDPIAPAAPAAPKTAAPRSFAGDVGHTMLGEAELAGTGVGNLIPNAVNSLNAILNRIYRTPGAVDNPVPTFKVGEAGKDLVKTVAGFAPGTANGLNVSDNELRDNLDPGGTRPIEDLRAEYAKENNKSLPELFEEGGTVGGDLAANALRTAGDVANIAPVASLAKTGVNTVRSAAESAAAPIASGDIESALNAVGYKNLPRQGEGSGPARLGAKVVGEPSLTGPQTLTNQAVTDRLAQHEAGVPPDKDLDYASVAEARANGPGKIYNAAHDALPQTLAQDPELTSGIRSIGDSTSQLPRSPDVDALKDAMASQPSMTRDQLFANIQQARDRATKFFKSDKPDDQAMGDAYSALANHYEDFVGRQLAANPESPVTLSDWQAARTAFAKNYAVEAALQGNSVKASTLAALQRKDPTRLTGGLQLIAEQHNRYPLSTGFGPTTLAQPGVGSSGSLEGNIARHITGPTAGGAIGFGLGGPVGAAIGSGTGLLASNAFQSIIRRALSGSPSTAEAIAGKAVTDPRLGSFFDQLTQGAPGHEALPAFPPKAAPLSLADELGAGGQPEGAGEGIPLADVLSHGVEQPPAPGLSAGPMGTPKSSGVPFARNAEHEAGDLSTHEPTLMELLEDLRDHPAVMSQGVPEDIMQRTPARGSGADTIDFPSGRVNNASGESPASLEAINRTRREQASGQDRFLVDPDGKMWPIRGVEAADAKAPQGSIIVQKGIGGEPYSILDRGGLPRAHAHGLLNRALAGGHGMTLMDLLEGEGG